MMHILVTDADHVFAYCFLALIRSKNSRVGKATAWGKMSFKNHTCNTLIEGDMKQHQRHWPHHPDDCSPTAGISSPSFRLPYTLAITLIQILADCPEHPSSECVLSTLRLRPT